MNHTHKMWASAAVVGVIVVGGTSVAAAASAGRLDKAGREPARAVVRDSGPLAPPSAGPADQPPSEGAAPEDSVLANTDGVVVSTEVNPDPGEVEEFWTGERMEGAQPMPMPEAQEGGLTVAE